MASPSSLQNSFFFFVFAGPFGGTLSAIDTKREKQNNTWNLKKQKIQASTLSTNKHSAPHTPFLHLYSHNNPPQSVSFFICCRLPTEGE